MTRRMNNKELMEKIVELRTIIWNKRNSTDGSRELLEEYLMVLEIEATERIKVAKEELYYLEEMLWKATEFSGDNDGDEESPKSKYIITLL